MWVRAGGRRSRRQVLGSLGAWAFNNFPTASSADDYSWDQRQERAKGEEKMGVPTADEVASESDDLTS